MIGFETSQCMKRSCKVTVIQIN